MREDMTIQEVVDSVPARVAAGLELIQEKVPGYKEIIDVNIIDVWSTQTCVAAQIGQWFGGLGYGAGLDELGIPSHSEAKDYGFDVYGIWTEDDSRSQELEYEALNAEWKRVLSA